MAIRRGMRAYNGYIPQRDPGAEPQAESLLAFRRPTKATKIGPSNC